MPNLRLVQDLPSPAMLCRCTQGFGTIGDATPRMVTSILVESTYSSHKSFKCATLSSIHSTNNIKHESLLFASFHFSLACTFDYGCGKCSGRRSIKDKYIPVHANGSLINCFVNAFTAKRVLQSSWIHGPELYPSFNGCCHCEERHWQRKSIFVGPAILVIRFGIFLLVAL
jgi:hypothetical protein